MLAAAIEAEVADYIERHSGERDERGHALVTRSGWAQLRMITLGSGTVEFRSPCAFDRRVDEPGAKQHLTSRILPPYMRRNPNVSDVLPVLYLRGVSTGGFKEALPMFLGEEATV